ncbi:MAG: LysR family transcriptional regulator [Granulosicoccus sp.]
MYTRYNLNRLVYFVATVEEGTITAAANRLGLSKAVVSKQLQLLEEEVGVALLQRSTRQLQPTEAGNTFFHQGQAVLQQANDAFEAALERGQVPSGKIRITAPVGYGVSHVAPLAARFRERFPRVNIDLILNDQPLDIVEQRIDVAFRVGWLTDSNNIARKLQDFRELAVCSPRTLELYNVRNPEELVKIPHIASRAFAAPKKGEFRRNQVIRTVELKAAMTANFTLAVLNATIIGDCFAILPDYVVADDIEKGKLVNLFPDWSLRTGGVYAVCPPNKLRASAVKEFLDMVQRELGH